MNDEIVKLLKQNNFIPTEEPYVWLKELGYDYNLQGETYEEYDLTNDSRRKEIEKIIGRKIKIDNIKPKKETIKIDEYLLTHPNIMQSTTGYEIKTVARVTTIANFNRKKGGDMECYAYKKDVLQQLKELREQGVKVPTDKTFNRHMKALSKIMLDDKTPYITIEDTPNGVVYKIKQSYDGKWFTTIPVEQMKDLLISTNHNVIKLYLIFKYTCDENNWKRVDRGYLCRQFGIEGNEKNKDYITSIVNALARLGYIKRKYEWVSDTKHSNGYKACYYQLTTMHEWKEIKKNAGLINKK